MKPRRKDPNYVPKGLTASEALSRKKFVSQINSGLVLRGNSYEVKDQIKALGCVWSTRDHCWYAPNERARQQAQVLIDAPSISELVALHRALTVPAQIDRHAPLNCQGHDHGTKANAA